MARHSQGHNRYEGSHEGAMTGLHNSYKGHQYYLGYPNMTDCEYYHSLRVKEENFDVEPENGHGHMPANENFSNHSPRVKEENFEVEPENLPLYDDHGHMPAS